MILRLAAAMSAAVVAVCAAGAWLFSRHHYAEAVASAQAAARVQAEIVLVALEHQMMENERDLIARMVSTFARDPSIDRVRILDREGVVRFSSDPAEAGARWSPSAPECRTCHTSSHPPSLTSALLDSTGGAVLRSVLPIENRPACHGCHEPARRLNGVLFVDVRTGALRAAVDRDLRWLLAATAGMALALLAALGLIVRVVVLRRLRTFEEAARAIAGGDLARRAPEDGNDVVGWMGREFNAMAESVTRLAGELREQREHLESVINAVDDGIVVLDPSLRVVAANEAFLARTGRPRLQVVGARCDEVLGGGCPREGCPARRCFASAEPASDVLSRGPAGAVRHEEVHASPVRRAGAVTSVVEVWRDITERRAAEGRLADSHRLASLGLLASGFSHEINTPMATVLACLEGSLRTLDAGPIGEEQRQGLAQDARLAREQILRCRGITQQFLRLSRGQAAATEAVDAGAAAAAVVRLAEPTARERGVALTLGPVEAPATVRASDAELQQVVLNLVLNALQSCARGGHVAVAVLSRAGRGVRVRVADDGCGIPPAQRARIFEPFFSLRPGGTGLGLFVSLNLARGWGADLRAESEPGRGSVFEVVFESTAGEGTDGDRVAAAGG